ncbi:hypothetical protein BS50DRAFT_569881 [Corynespora cassiicola Philippines]|uniref:Uncharacterized protein n=1 Tax=Corynespora cassiicola Philippines TaxID=1448308 RepID=A0A2T2P4C8_CORCC|nr:hypothetical protein BS50DRAFT_569881 [Corynespora cassiicola Philippines]
MDFEASYNHAGRNSNHTFRDLRSASRAKHRTRAHLKKYRNFKTITRGDLPSHPSQNSHLLPVCILPECPTQDTSDGHLFSVFPADLSTAPTSKFTPRTAYEEAQFANYAHRHHSRIKNDGMKWQKRRASRKQVNREIADEHWIYDLDDEYWDGRCGYQVSCFCCAEPIQWYLEYGWLADGKEHIGPCTRGDETAEEWLQHVRNTEVIRSQTPTTTIWGSGAVTTSEGHDIMDEEDEGYYSDSSQERRVASTDERAIALLEDFLKEQPAFFDRARSMQHPFPVASDDFNEGFQMHWHRNLTGCWYADITMWECGKQWWDPCACRELKDVPDPEGRQPCSLVEWTKGRLRQILEEEYLLSREAFELAGEYHDVASVVESDWDVLSVAISEPWSEIDEMEFDYSEADI